MTKKMLAVLFVGFVLLSAPDAFAAKWQVPGHFSTVQDAINSPSVANGDTIMVGPGAFDGALVRMRK